MTALDPLTCSAGVEPHVILVMVIIREIIIHLSRPRSLCFHRFQFVISFVCSLAGLCKNCSTDIHKKTWKGGTWATEATVRVLYYLDHIILGL